MDEQLKQLEKERKELADKLEFCDSLLQEYIRVLRGEDIDYTSCGLEKIFLTNLGMALNVKVIPRDD